MVALAIALVLCCAMVCGTRVYLRTVETSKSHSDLVSRLHALGSRADATCRALDELVADVDKRCGQMQAELDDLKKNAAYRSLR